MWLVYLLRCSDGSLYCGITNDIDRRLSQHNKGKGAKYTRTRLPVNLVYLENAESKSAALKKEAMIKKMQKKTKEWLVLSTLGAC